MFQRKKNRCKLSGLLRTLVRVKTENETPLRLKNPWPKQNTSEDTGATAKLNPLRNKQASCKSTVLNTMLTKHMISSIRCKVLLRSRRKPRQLIDVYRHHFAAGRSLCLMLCCWCRAGFVKCFDIGLCSRSVNTVNVELDLSNLFWHRTIDNTSKLQSLLPLSSVFLVRTCHRTCALWRHRALWCVRCDVLTPSDKSMEAKPELRL